MAEHQLRNLFSTLTDLPTGQGEASFYRVGALADQLPFEIDKLPYSIRILLESVLRAENGREVTAKHVQALATYDPLDPAPIEIPFCPGRVLLQDYSGVPAVIDLAAMRSAIARLGGDPKVINPNVQVDLVIDHSLQVDHFGTDQAREKNEAREFERNRERYEFLRWGQQAFANFRVIPPGSGIIHQLNLEYLANVVQERAVGGKRLLFADTLVGTDSHTTMTGGMGVLGWGVGGIEAEAMMLGQPLYMPAPPVVGVKIIGRLPGAATATDLVLTLTELLRKTGVVGKFVEFYGPGVDNLTVPDRATIANMAPDYGATMGYFPVDEETLNYLGQTGRSPELINTVKRYCKAQDLFCTDSTPEPLYAENLEFDLEMVRTSLAGPKRPQDRVNLSGMKTSWHRDLAASPKERGFGVPKNLHSRILPYELAGQEVEIGHGAVAIAAITSCTNTANPALLITAGLVAKNAIARGLRVKPWVKTSLAPGSLVVTDYLRQSGLLEPLEKLGFNVVGYGCTTCIGNSGPLAPVLEKAAKDDGFVLAGVLSGNRNFEGRVSPLVHATYLASPPLVVAYALAGSVAIDLTAKPLGLDREDYPVFLKDIWPTTEEVNELVARSLQPSDFQNRYADIENANARWNEIPTNADDLYAWSEESDYIHEPPFFRDMALTPPPLPELTGARVLVKLGDSITTDHISPAGGIAVDSPAADYLRDRGVDRVDFNAYGTRRGDDRVMTRGTFANVRLQNQLAPKHEGGFTTHHPSGEVTTIYDAANRYQEESIPTIVLAGKEYGTGSSRDWAAKGTSLLGIKAVIAESFERIHRSNLVGMGVLPLVFAKGENAQKLGLTGLETFDLILPDTLEPRCRVKVEVGAEEGERRRFTLICRLDTPVEVEYYQHGGILPLMLRKFNK